MFDIPSAEGVGIVGFGGQVGNWARPITHDFQVDVDEIERVAPRMREVDCRFLCIMSYPNDPNSPLPRGSHRDEAFRRISHLAELAEKEEIVLVHENCSGGYGESLEGVRELLNAIPNPALQLVMDTGNTSLHETDVEVTRRYYEATRDRTAHIHVKCAKPNPGGGDYIICFPKEDPVQARILRGIAVRGYDGWISIDPHIMAAVHAGKDVVDAEAAVNVWVRPRGRTRGACRGDHERIDRIATKVFLLSRVLAPETATNLFQIPRVAETA